MGSPLTHDATQLRHLIENHLAKTTTAHALSKLVDLGLAKRIADACLALLDEWPALPEAHKAHLQHAVLYFADEDDDEDDFDSIIGFDDDAEVLNQACIAIGRPDLTIDF